jgi:hypothetical protein
LKLLSRTGQSNVLIVRQGTLAVPTSLARGATTTAIKRAVRKSRRQVRMISVMPEKD